MQVDTPEVLYGGAAGGGKSEALLMAALQFVEVPNYAAILFRRTYADLSLPGALMDRAHEQLGGTGAKWSHENKTWTFPSGATLSFGYLDNENDRFRYGSTEFQYIGFDELTQFRERDYRFLFTRLRRTTDSQVPLRMRCGTNPGGSGHSWVKKRFIKQQTKNRRFVKALIEDNPYIDVKEYEGVSLSQLDSQTRKQYRHGDWTDFGGEHYHPDLWPRYIDTGDAYRIGDGAGRWRHIRKAECVRILTLDWAVGKPKKGAIPQGAEGAEVGGDCTAFLVADMTDDADGLLFPLGCINERIALASKAPRLAEMCRRWQPLIVAGDDDNLTETMMLECRRFRDIPSIKTVSIGSRNKITRSQAAIVRAERGKIFLPEYDTPWSEEMCDQLASFTGADGESDDIADAMSIMGRLADEFRPGAQDELENDSVVGSEGYNGGVW